MADVRVEWNFVTTRVFLDEIEEPWMRDLAEQVAIDARMLGSSSVRTGALLTSVHVEIFQHSAEGPVAQVRALPYGVFLDDTFNEHAEQVLHDHPFLTTALLLQEG